MSFIILLASCDVPRSRTTIYDGSYASQVPSSQSPGSFYDDPDDKELPEVPTDPVSIIPTEYQYCVNPAIPFPRTSSYIGNYFICQQQTDKTKVYFWPENRINTQVCMIPLYSNGSSSINIGDAQCQYISSTTQGVEFTLYKNRAGFENYVMNAVMIMRDESMLYPYPYTLKYSTPISNTTAFYLCMDTAYQTAAYCQAFASLRQYQLHLF